MRNENQMLNSFMPLHEKEWESRLFIDEAIKNKCEYALEAIARALSGVYNIEFEYREEKYKTVEHIEGDCKTWITKTREYKIYARMREYHFYGNTKTEIWIKIIDFWAGKVSIFPCGGASFPNNTLHQ